MKLFKEFKKVFAIYENFIHAYSKIRFYNETQCHTFTLIITSNRYALSLYANYRTILFIYTEHVTFYPSAFSFFNRIAKFNIFFLG